RRNPRSTASRRPARHLSTRSAEATAGTCRRAEILGSRAFGPGSCRWGHGSVLPADPVEDVAMTRTFGTDGIRGPADQITDALAEAVGRAAVRVLGGSRLLIGRDPRESGPRIVAALARGAR